MNWLNVWAFLQVAGTIIGAILVFIILLIISNDKGGKE